MSNEKIAPETTATNDSASEESAAEVEKPAQDAEGKLLLGKKVLRHFGVRSDVQAGTYSVVGRCR